MADPRNLQPFRAAARHGVDVQRLPSPGVARRAGRVKLMAIFSAPIALLLGGILLCSACCRQEPQYHGESLSHWEKQASAKDIKVRREAMDALSELGRPGVPALVKLLHDTDRDIRKRAVQTLVEMQVGATVEISEWATGNQDALKILEELCLKEQGEGYFIALALTGPDAVPIFERLIMNEDRSIAWTAAMALEEMQPSEDAVPVLKEAIKKSPHREVRERAAESLRACQQVE